MRRKGFNRFLAVALSTVMAVSGMSFSQPSALVVKAETTNLLTDGGLGDDEYQDFWNNGVWNYEESVGDIKYWDILGETAYSEYAKQDGTSGLGISFYKGEGTVALYQTVSSLEAGEYLLSGYQKDASLIQGYLDSTSNAVSENSCTESADGWEKFGFVFQVEEDKTDCKVGLLISAVQNAWVCLDTLSLTKIENPEPETTVDFTNGDFEKGDLTGWTVIYEDKKYEVTTDEWATNNTTQFLKLKSPTTENTNFQLDQTIADVKAGTYKVTFDADGCAADVALTIKAGETEVCNKEISLSESDWDNWKTYSSGAFEVASDCDLTVTLSGSMASSYWGDLDNFKLTTTTEEPEEPEEPQEPEVPEITKDDLQVLIDSVPDDYSNMNFSDTESLKSALQDAKACIENESATSEEIKNCYDALAAAIEKLIIRDEDVFVDKIDTISENDIRGMDVSSYISIMDAFDKLNEGKAESEKLGFKDADGNVLSRQGFFDLLAKNGVNYIRLRVWNNPYDESENGYGGGNNDLDKAIEMGQYATKAGMKVLIDFHFSDFWADPGKQKAPKEWAAYSVDQKATAIKNYTTSSLNALLDAGVDVGMVQIGNETNGKFCGESGESGWNNMNILFDAGCDAVHAVAEEKGKEILAVLHFTNPEAAGRQAGYAKNLAGYDSDGDGNPEGVSYDVFATSYYPVWHGTLNNLTTVLSNIADTYDKYVMVAETSWAYTLEDTDGHENTVRAGKNDTKPDGQEDWWNISVQGQVNEFRDVLNAVVSIDKGLGAFWWEGAWVAVQNAYDKNGNLDENVLKENKSVWETTGSGWASSYSTEYDPEDAGKWYGGSAVENQGFFDADGKVMPSIKVYDYNNLKYGTTTDVKKDDFEIPIVTVIVGETFEMPETIQILYNDGTTKEVSVTWEAEEVASVQEKAGSVKNLGTYKINGIADGSKVFCKVTILPVNLLENPGFESSTLDSTEDTYWTISGDGYDFTSKEMKDSRTGSKCLHFYNGEEFDFTVSQTVSVNSAGTYAAEYYIQGSNEADKEATAQMIVTVSGNGIEKDVVYQTDALDLEGWRNWVCPSVDEIEVTDEMLAGGDVYITVTAKVDGKAGAWGTLDDFALYQLSGAAEEPDKPVDPEDPEEPDTPVDPEDPEKPDTPVDPEDPEEPDTPIGPEKPIIPDEPGTPEQPDGPTISGNDTPENKPEKKIESFTKPSVTVEVGKTIEMPKTVKVTYNDKTSEDVSVTWNAAELAAVQAKAASEEGVGTYTVNGELKDGTKVTCEVKIVAGDKPTTPETPAETEPAPADKGTKLATTTGSFKVTTTDSAAAPEVVFTAPKNKKATTVTIPASIKDENGVSYKVTSVAPKAFQNNKKIKTVKLGSNIKSVGKNAFKGCTNLKKVTLDKNLKEISSSAFAGCTKLTSVTIPAGVKEIQSNAFNGCKNLKKITIQTTVLKKVGSKAFKGIHKNAVIKVPKKKLSAYKKLLKNKGQASTVQIKK